MRWVVLTDASCDLPDSTYQHYGIKLMPHMLRIGPQWILDERDPHVSEQLYRHHQLHGSGAAQWRVASAAEIHQRIVERLLPRYDYVLFITSDSRQSLLHRHALQAAFSLLDSHTTLTLDTQRSARFGIRIVDSRQVGAGLGRLVVEACERLIDGEGPAEVAGAIEQCRYRLQGFCVPGPSQQQAIGAGRIAARLQQRLGRVPLLRRDRHGVYQAQRHYAGRARALDALLTGIAAKIDRGAVVGPIVLAHGADPDSLQSCAAYRRLETAAANAKLALRVARIGVSRMLEIGSGATELAYLGLDDV